MRRLHLISTCLIIVSCSMGACSLKDINETEFHCGESQKNCTTLDPYWAGGECINGDCVTRECIVGAHLSENATKCERDTVESCGKDSKNCYEQDLICSKGECVSICESNEINCHGACRDLSSNIDDCGKCDNPCPNDDNGKPSCQNSQCHLECNEGYTLSSNGLSCQKVDQSPSERPQNKPDCLRKGTCTCDDSQGNCTPECTTGYTGDACDECADGYKLNEENQKCEPISEPPEPECDDEKIVHGHCSCEGNPETCTITCDTGYAGDNCSECDTDNGYTPNDSGECTKATNPEEPKTLKQCTKDEDCYLTNGVGKCQTSTESQHCSTSCSDEFEFDSLNYQCVLKDVTCTSGNDCPKTYTNMKSLCFSKKDAPGVCTYMCKPSSKLDIFGNCIEDCLCKVDSHGEFTCVDKVCEYTCDIGYRPKSDHTGCELDGSKITCTPENCLKEHENWTQAECEDNQCKATECNPGYHLYTEMDQKENKPDCEEDTETHCGSHETDCTQAQGWSTGECANSQCKATSCKSGYLLKNHVCIKDLLNNCSNGFFDCNGDGSKCCADKSDCNSTSLNTKCFLLAEPGLPIDDP
ncbi:MAG: hypothetical protein J6A01_09935 [Proteobacteria bacterium]|nr:hypothetical protein [Pseudomonadota bacterium]